MSEPTVLAAVVSRVQTVVGSGADLVSSGAPDPLPAVQSRPVIVVRRSDEGVQSIPLTLRYDRRDYGIEIVAYLGTPRSSGKAAGARAAQLAPLLAGAWTADHTLGGACWEARYLGDSSNLATYRGAKEAPRLTARLRITEHIRRGT